MTITKMKLAGGIVNNGSMNLIGAGELFTTGTVTYVSSVLGSNDNLGTDPAFPKSSVNGGISAATASVGDTLVLMPGHAETVTSSNITLSKAGLNVIGLGQGLNRPRFTFGAAAATINVSAANISVSGCDFFANFADVAAGFTVGAAKDFVVANSTFRDSASNLNFLSPVVTGSTNNDADGLTFVGNNIYSLPATDGAVVSILANESRVVIADNFANKAATNNAGHFITLSSKVVTGIQILRNTLIVVGATNATVGIFMTGSGTTSTGVMAGNFVASLDTTTELIITAGTGIAQFENYYTGTADASGKLWPVVDAA